MKKSEVLAPTPIKYPVAYAGLKNTIPLLPTGTNNASITEGFPEMTMKALKDGGLPPRGEDFNGLFYLTTDQKAFFQDGGYITFDPTVSTLIGGYPQGAILDYYNETTNYYTKVESLIDDNTNNFVNDPSLIDNVNWRYVDFGTGANENLSNITALALDRINQSKELETGNVSADTVVLTQIKQMAHSSFDLSKFTVIGSPTISSDGIVTSFGQNDGISAPALLPANASWEVGIEQEITADALSSGRTNFVFFTTNADKGVNVQTGYGNTTNDNFIVQLYIPDAGLQYDLLRLNCNSQNDKVSAGDIQGLKLGYDSTTTTYYFKAYKNGVEYASTSNVSTGILNQANVTDTLIGLRRNNASYSLNNIDLKTYYVKYNGVTVFSGNQTGVDTYTINSSTVSIPYTLSKTGSKIVDAAYRNSVTALYNQEGCAPYITLDEENGNFTLPMGELYGMIEKRARDIAHPIGEPFFRFTDEINDDEVRLEGAEVDKGLYQTIEDNLAAYCTAGSTSDKICLPDFRGRVPWGASDYGYIEAGLPDHYHACPMATFSQGHGGEEPLVSSSNESVTTGLASLSNPIYGNSITVQPPAFKVRWLARYK